ncbi:MAG: hypothetical protein KC900_09035 [Candidatus Omnitrophica bacterium]|nr:hypothetical protein [Candidatus Omnitrophota bacterium]
MDTELLIQIKKLIIVVVVCQLAFMLGVLVYKLLRRLREVKLQRGLLERLAAQFSGHYEPGKKLGYPRATVPLAGYDLNVYYRPRTRYKNASTIVEAGVPGNKDLEFYIYTKSMLSDVAKVLGMQDVEIGQHVFDQKFIVKTNKELVIKDFLNQDLCRHILGLPMRNISMRYEKGRFVLAVQQMLTDDRDYQQLVETAKLLIPVLGEKA